MTTKAIGEIIELGDVKIIVEKGGFCQDCFFYDKSQLFDCSRFDHFVDVGYCGNILRTDNEKIIFKQVAP